MKPMPIRKLIILPSLIVCFSAAALGQGSNVLSSYESMARKNNPGFSGFSAAEGQKFYFQEQKTSKGKLMSCATCHTKNPKALGQTPLGKEIKALAPSANSERFTDLKKVEKWFKRNCDDVYERECTIEEKGNFVMYLQSIQ